MPCCLTILQFGCGHKQLWKTHCSAHCRNDTICPDDQREIIAYICYKWQCEDCLTGDFDDDDTVRTDAMDEMEASIVNDQSLNEVQIEAKLWYFREREAWVDARIHARHTQKVEEVQGASEFAEAYGTAVWNAKYGDEGDGLLRARHLEFLRRSKRWDVTIAHDAVRDSAKTPAKASRASQKETNKMVAVAATKRCQRQHPGILLTPPLDSETDAHAAPSA